ncbi:MAG TPA: sugar dehydrogenase complex small subunit [Vicinamibacterales bacterium]|nr:sugar dehydrogenase complex small subunit [Vicinamibacterales bacterium]
MQLGRRAFIAALGLVTPWFRAAPRVQSFSLDEFLALSSRLTGYTNLDREIGGILLNNLLAAPDTAAGLARPDAALERDIIVAWYTGVQQVRGDARLVTHGGALQWRALGMPAPGLCVGPFGTWAKPHRASEP